jgi:hypothetical protein
MEEIIDGKRYDTEADGTEILSSWRNSYHPGDFHYYEESLYVTKRGNYFIAGSGGALSKYSRSCGNGSCGGRGITPVSEEEAAKWMEKHGSTDEMIEFFPDYVEEA